MANPILIDNQTGEIIAIGDDPWEKCREETERLKQSTVNLIEQMIATGQAYLDRKAEWEAEYGEVGPGRPRKKLLPDGSRKEEPSFWQEFEANVGVSQRWAWGLMLVAEHADQARQLIQKSTSECSAGYSSIESIVKLIRDLTRSALPPPPETPVLLDDNLVIGDFCEVGDGIPDNSVDLIFTDPPYAQVDLYAALAELAVRVLKPGGLCLAYSGQVYLPEILLEMSGNLDYIWIASIHHTGGEMRFRNLHIHCGWKPILMFAKPPLIPWWEWFTDIISGGKDKRFHEWQQPEAEAAHYIAALCPPGGMVLDPMCGSGTTLVAAKKLGLRYFGIDLDAANIARTEQRLEEIP